MQSSSPTSANYAASARQESRNRDGRKRRRTTPAAGWHERCVRGVRVGDAVRPAAPIARKDFDRVAAWSVDRIGRSLPDLVGFLEELRAKGVDLYLHQQSLDTATPAGRMVIGMCSVFAAFEREMIVERVNAGLARARARGTTLGRPTRENRKDWPEIERRILELRADGMGVVKIGRTLKIGTSVVQRILAP